MARAILGHPRHAGSRSRPCSRWQNLGAHHDHVRALDLRKLCVGIHAVRGINGKQPRVTRGRGRPSGRHGHKHSRPGCPPGSPPRAGLRPTAATPGAAAGLVACGRRIGGVGGRGWGGGCWGDSPRLTLVGLSPRAARGRAQDQWVCCRLILTRMWAHDSSRLFAPTRDDLAQGASLRWGARVIVDGGAHVTGWRGWLHLWGHP